MNINDAIDDFINYCVFEKGLSDKTRESYKYDLSIYCDYLTNLNINNVNDISTKDIEEFLKYRNENNDMTSTIAHKLTVIKNFHSYLFKTKVVDNDVSESISRPKLIKKIPKAVSMEDIDKLLDIKLDTQFDYRNKAMIELMYATGLRVSELVNLEINDINLIDDYVRVYGKGKKERIIPMADITVEIMDEYINVYRNSLLKGYLTDKVFISSYGKGITRQGFFKIIKKQAKEVGLLGENILNSGFNFDIEIKYGPGAFVCGEETALIKSIEGSRGEPTNKPPFPAVSGLWSKPTSVNNVETFANIPAIINRGADWYSSIGTEKSKGTKVFALAGKINNVGLVEVPMGITLREIIYEIGEGVKDGKKLKAVQTGGPSGGCIPAELLDVPIDYDSLLNIGSMMGSGGMIVMDEDNCMVDIAKFYMEFIVDESCGKCTPCRVGCKRLLEMLQKITEGKATLVDLKKLQVLSESIKDTALCGLGQTAANPIISTMKYFMDEYEAHVKEHKCYSGICKKLLKYRITDKCFGCTKCAKGCPAGCIKGKPREKHVIDQNKCIKCGACEAICPFKAIVRE